MLLGMVTSREPLPWQTTRLHPLTTVLTAQQSTLGQNLFSSQSAKLSHLGKPFRLQLSEYSTAHLSFWWVLLTKVPKGSTSIYIFLALELLGKKKPLILAVTAPCKIRPSEIDATTVRHWLMVVNLWLMLETLHFLLNSHPCLYSLFASFTVCAR